MLNRYGVQYNREESEKVDSLRYSVQKLFSQSVSKKMINILRAETIAFSQNF